MATKQIYSNRGLKFTRDSRNDCFVLESQGQVVQLTESQLNGLIKAYQSLPEEVIEVDSKNVGNSELSQFIKRHREKAGVSQSELSDHMGYSTAQFISNWERGISAPPVDQLKKVCVKIRANADEAFRLLEKRAVEEAKQKLIAEFVGG